LFLPKATQGRLNLQLHKVASTILIDWADNLRDSGNDTSKHRSIFILEKQIICRLLRSGPNHIGRLVSSVYSAFSGKLVLFLSYASREGQQCNANGISQLLMLRIHPFCVFVCKEYQPLACVYTTLISVTLVATYLLITKVEQIIHNEEGNLVSHI
jgi:hypothetical protein